PGKVAAFQKVAGKAFKAQRMATQNDDLKWTVAAAAGADWAKHVFPDLKTSEEQVDALWDQIFKTCRIYHDDPVEAWDNHKETLMEKEIKINLYQFDALHYIVSWIYLTRDLPKLHIWMSVEIFDSNGLEFISNIPTEYVFTSPHTLRMDGVVRSTK